eukprot:c34140_g1_i1 orf=347-1252(+)
MDTAILNSDIQFGFFEDDRWLSSQMQGSVDDSCVVESYLNLSDEITLPSFLHEDPEGSAAFGQLLPNVVSEALVACPGHEVTRERPAVCKENTAGGVLKGRRKSAARSSSDVNRKKKVALACQELKMDDESKTPRKKEPHFLCERQRRRNMQDQFKTLISLLPYTLPKTDKLAVLNATVDHIEDLKKKLDKLVLEKAALTSSLAKDSASADQAENQQTSSYSLKIQVYSQGNEWFITLNNSSEAKLYSGIMLVLEEYGFEVLNWNMSSHNNEAFHTVRALQTHGPSNLSPELLKQSLSKLL